MKAFLFISLSILCANIVRAQSVIDNLNNWSSAHPIQKVYLYTDRDQYFAGETIWLKGYFLSEFLPSISNTSLYVELVEKDMVIQREIFPVYAGIAMGQLELPDTLQGGQYQIRAYSQLMLNQPGFTFNKPVTIYGREAKKGTDKTSNAVRVNFFPEGGNFVTALPNIVAFKVTDKTGLPAQAEGEIRNNNHEKIAEFRSVHDGMGTFTITPKKGEKYYALLKGDDQEFMLPEPVDNGVILQVSGTNERKDFKIIVGGKNEVFRPAYLVGQIQNHIIFKQKLQPEKNEITGFVKTGELYSGILQLTVFNKDDMPLAERITFVNNREYVLDAVFKTDTINVDKRRKNHFTITLPDSVVGNFSVSVTDADYENHESNATNIYSSFLLTSDVKGYIHNPAYYFQTDNDTTEQALDLVMMTNGWTRFKWADMARADFSEKGRIKDAGYIRLSGRILIEGTKKPLSDKEVVLFISPSDSESVLRGMTRLVQTNHSGYFTVDSLFFYGKMHVWFSEVRGEKNKFLTVVAGSDSLHQNLSVMSHVLPDRDSATTLVSEKMEIDFRQFMKEKGIVLENVVVKARQKTEIEKLDEEYSSGFFSGNVFSRRLDLRNVGYGGNIFDYLKERIPELQIVGDPGNYVLNYRGGNLTYYTDGAQVDGGDAQPTTNNGNVSLFLNEMQTNTMALESIPLNEIAMVKLFPYSVMSAGGGPALAVYTKKERDLRIPSYSPTTMIVYNGYSIIKEFYQPDYDLHPQNSESDNRITLCWNPDITVSGMNNIIPIIFFNNDRSKRFKIVAEGVTSEGQMLMLEKIVEQK